VGHGLGQGKAPALPGIDRHLGRRRSFGATWISRWAGTKGRHHCAAKWTSRSPAITARDHESGIGSGAQRAACTSLGEMNKVSLQNLAEKHVRSGRRTIITLEDPTREKIRDVIGQGAVAGHTSDHRRDRPPRSNIETMARCEDRFPFQGAGGPRGAAGRIELITADIEVGARCTKARLARLLMEPLARFVTILPGRRRPGAHLADLPKSASNASATKLKEGDVVRGPKCWRSTDQGTRGVLSMRNVDASVADTAATAGWCCCPAPGPMTRRRRVIS